MENKQSMIEEWAKKVEHSKKQELSKEAAKRFMTICLNAKKIDEDQELIADLENNRHGVGSAFWLRVKHLHTYSVTPSLALFLASDVLDDFGKSTMMAAYLQYIAVKRGIKTIGISEWAKWAFPWGLPTEDEWQRLWDAQKIPFDMRKDTMTDNMLDCPNLFGKSIWEIKGK